jgi:hypothetical protein
MSFSYRRVLELAVILVSASVPTSFAQSVVRTPLVKPAAVCPVQLRSLEVRGDRLLFDYRNSSDKQIQGILFGAAYFDSVQDPHRIIVMGGDNKHLRPGQLRRSGYSVKYWHHTGIEGWTIWPSKILFNDGSTWIMGQQSTACSAARWMDKQVAAPALPAAVLTMMPESVPPRYR